MSVSNELMNILKAQAMSMGFMNNNSNNNSNTRGSSSNGMFQMMFGLFMMQLMEKCGNVIPVFIDSLRDIITKYITSKQKLLLDQLPKDITKKEKKCGIVLEKVFSKSPVDSDICDALLDYISNLNEVKFVKYRNTFLINNKEVISLNPLDKRDIKLKLVSKVMAQDGAVEMIILEIFSFECELQDLRKFLDELRYRYNINKKNKLGDQPYFFNEIVQSVPMGSDRKLNYSGAPRHLKFSMTAFYSNKTLDNIYGENVKKIRDQFRYFINNKDWYKKKGIPYTFGLLLSGPPGVGKTSLIKALANETGYHIINMSLHNSMTKTQLNNLFYSEKIFVERDNMMESYIIPTTKRIYVIEDIDCMTDIVLDREFVKSSTDDSIVLKTTTNNFISDYEVEDKSEKLTLSFLLNLLDGVLEIPGRILIITSNYPERLDKALIRCGRIDLNINFKKCDRKMMLEMISNFYDINLSDEDVNMLNEDTYTPAMLNQVLFTNKDDYKKAIECLSKVSESEIEQIEPINEDEKIENNLNNPVSSSSSELDVDILFPTPPNTNTNSSPISSISSKISIETDTQESLESVDSVNSLELMNYNYDYNECLDFVSRNKFLCSVISNIKHNKGDPIEILLSFKYQSKYPNNMFMQDFYRSNPNAISIMKNICKELHQMQQIQQQIDTINQSKMFAVDDVIPLNSSSTYKSKITTGIPLNSSNNNSKYKTMTL